MDSDSQYRNLLHTTYSSNDSHDDTFNVNSLSEMEETTDSETSMDDDEFKLTLSLENDDDMDAHLKFQPKVAPIPIDIDDAESTGKFFFYISRIQIL